MPKKLSPQNFEIYSGDTKTLKFTVKDQDDVIKDISAASVKWSAARKRTGTAQIQKTSDAGQITITDGPNGLLEVALVVGDTKDRQGDYYHELEITDVAGRISTASYGTMRIRADLIT